MFTSGIKGTNMTHTKHLLAAIAGSSFLMACQHEAVLPEPAQLVEAPAMSEEKPEKTKTAACEGIYETRGWEAWINRMPGPDMVPTLHVAGEVDTRTGGYSFKWQEGPLDRSAVPALRLRLVPVAPDDMATQAIVTHQVSYETPLPAHGYSRVIIGCGDEMIAEIAEISDVY